EPADKRFSAFYGNTVIKGRQGSEAGKHELEELLSMIFRNNETALFICRKIYRWFVYYDIDEAVEEKVIEPMAATLRENNYDIKPVLKVLLSSNHFFDTSNYGVQIKSPIDFCVGLQREFNVRFHLDEKQVLNYDMWKQLLEFCSKMGQEPGNP